VTAAIPFAGLAPDHRSVRGRGELASFDLQTALDAGQDLLRSCPRDGSTRDIATALVELVNAFEHSGRAGCVLVRAFVTRRGDQLPPELAPEAHVDPRRTYLQLLATRGLEPAWDDVARAENRGLLTLRDRTSPLTVELERQLQIEDASQPPTGTFYIADARTSAAVPDKEFVASHSVRSVFGFGARAWPGETVVLIAFSRADLDRKTVKSLDTVAHYARLAWLDSREASAQLDRPSYAALRSDSLAHLLSVYELSSRESNLQHRSDVTASRAEAQLAAEQAAAEVERHNHELRRIQRAMLNVIEDLREARASLATTVEIRTRELATANRQLEVRNRELEEFAYIASHDLQEPLRTVSGYLQMIERRYSGKLPAEGDEFIRFAIEGAQRMQALIESLLLYSRVASADRRFESVALQEPFDLALRNLALRIEETQAVIACGPLPTLRADATQMTQLFQNLLSNALKFAGERPPRVEVTARAAGAVHVIEVRDWGIGFPDKFSERIFKVFRRLRRDTEGTGIGLAVCKKIAERHGGRITARSAPDQGATFTVELAADPDFRG
jgi:signal transduction histidine kinase